MFHYFIQTNISCSKLTNTTLYNVSQRQKKIITNFTHTVISTKPEHFLILQELRHPCIFMQSNATFSIRITNTSATLSYMPVSDSATMISYSTLYYTTIFTRNITTSITFTQTIGFIKIHIFNHSNIGRCSYRFRK